MPFPSFMGNHWRLEDNEPHRIPLAMGSALEHPVLRVVEYRLDPRRPTRLCCARQHGNDAYSLANPTETPMGVTRHSITAELRSKGTLCTHLRLLQSSKLTAAGRSYEAWRKNSSESGSTRPSGNRRLGLQTTWPSIATIRPRWAQIPPTFSQR